MSEQDEGQGGEAFGDAGAPEFMDNQAEGEQQESREEGGQENARPSQPKQAHKEANYQPYVDLSGLDEPTRKAIEGRFAHFSRMMKKNEQRYDGELNQWRSVADQQAKLIEELQNGVVSVVDHLQSKSMEDTEAQLRLQIRQAAEVGDIEAQLNAQDKLIEIRTQKALKQQQQKQAKPQSKLADAQPNVSYPTNAAAIGAQGLAGGEITQEDYRALEAWQEEYDESGSSLRPWAQKDDPRHQQALIEAIAVFKNPQYARVSFEQKLAEIDRRMGTKKASNPQMVMGGGLTGVRKSQKITVSPEIERLAVRTKFGGPKAKSDAEHIQAYVKQMEAVRQKGARK